MAVDWFHARQWCLDSDICFLDSKVFGSSLVLICDDPLLDRNDSCRIRRRLPCAARRTDDSSVGFCYHDAATDERHARQFPD